ncbi:MAG TPA: carbohydrate ABC transporter permease [Firmicutes bacterium]|nr:carbohydrate ABC transporter permease [Bacillota bacterium]
MKRNERTINSLVIVVLTIGLLLSLTPFLWALITSLSTLKASVSWPPQIIPRPVMWQNYVEAWNKAPFGRFFINSFIQAFFVVIGQVITASLAGYAFARLRFPGRDALLLVVIGVIMIPFEVTMIPLFIMVYKLHWLNTYYALIVPLLATPFGTFLLRQFFLSIPREIEEAAIVDGCSRLGVLLRVILPLSKPALSTLTIFTFMGVWNSLLWPLLVVDEEAMRTVQVGLTYFKGQEFSNYPLLMAASIFTTIPVLLVFFMAQKQFVAGFNMSGIKG